MSCSAGGVGPELGLGLGGGGDGSNGLRRAGWSAWSCNVGDNAETRDNGTLTMGRRMEPSLSSSKVSSGRWSPLCVLGLDPCTDSSISPTVNTGPRPSPRVDGGETEMYESMNELEARLGMGRSSEKWRW